MSSLFSFSLGKKITLLSILPVILGIFALVSISVRQLESELYQAAAQKNETSAETLNGRLGGIVKFKQVKSLEKLVASYFEGSNLAALRVWGADGEIFFESGAPGHSEEVLGDLSQELASGSFSGTNQFFVQPIIYGKKQESIGFLATAWNNDKVEEKITDTTLDLLSVSAAILLAVIVTLIYLIRRSVSAPIQKTTHIMNEIAAGNLEVTVEGQNRRDEIGSMIQTIEVFKQNSLELRRAETERETARREAEESKRADMNRLASSFEDTVKSIVSEVSSAIEKMKAEAVEMSETAGQTNDRSGSVAAASAETTSNVQMVASASEELSSSIQEISRQVCDSSAITSEAVQQVEATNQKVEGLSQAANKIGEVIGLISDIAEQTNLLALNATIEAARAGDAGKGFAVVASEVKNLATQTAKATEDIGAQIGAMQSATDTAVNAIRGIGATISKVDGIASSISAAVEEQGAATQEISRNIQGAAASTQKISTTIEEVSDSADQTGQSAETIRDSASDLTLLSDRLDGEVESFLNVIKAA